jgi:hypothetical protein
MMHQKVPRRAWIAVWAGILSLGFLLSDPVVADFRSPIFDPMIQAVLASGKRIPPPNLARPAWDDLVRCTGIDPVDGKGFESIRWVRIPGPGFRWPGVGPRALGVWMSYYNMVLIAETRTSDPAVLKHELLHALLQGRAGRGHRHPEFHPSNNCGIYPVRD